MGNLIPLSPQHLNASQQSCGAFFIYGEPKQSLSVRRK